MATRNEFGIGDQVVYPSHGVGEVVGNEKQTIAGMDLKLYVIEFERDKMTLRVPMARTKEAGLRALSTKKIVDEAIATLKTKAKAGRGMWSRRAQEYESKINSGDVILTAEVVRDLYKNVDDPDRSYSERVIYESALSRLASEYAAVYCISMDDATDAVVKILKARKLSVVSSNETVVEEDNANEDDVAVAA